MSGLYVSSVSVRRLGYYFEGVASGLEDSRNRLESSEIDLFGDWAPGARPGGTGLGFVLSELAGLCKDERLSRPLANAAYDLCFVAPKQVSVLFGLFGEEVSTEVLFAHKQSVARILAEIEPALGWGSGGMVDAVGFVHQTSRSSDPHLHTHLLVANRIEISPARVRAIDSGALYRSVGDLSKRYRCYLAGELSRRLGILMVERDLETESGPTDIAGFPRRVSEMFSKRSVEVAREVAEWGTASLSASRAAALKTRQEKELWNPADLRTRWIRELSADPDLEKRLHKVLEVRRPPMRVSYGVAVPRLGIADHPHEFLARCQSRAGGLGRIGFVVYGDDLYQRMSAFSLGPIAAVIAGRKEVSHAIVSDQVEMALAECAVVAVLGKRVDPDVMYAVAHRYRHQDLVVALEEQAYAALQWPTLPSFGGPPPGRMGGPGDLASVLRAGDRVEVLRSSLQAVARGSGRLDGAGIPAVRLILPTRHDRDLARTEIAGIVGLKGSNGPFFNLEPVVIHYLPKRFELETSCTGFVDMEKGELVYPSGNSQKSIPLEAVDQRKMLSSLLAWAPGDARRTLRRVDLPVLRLGEFALCNLDRRSVSIYRSRSLDVSDGLDIGTTCESRSWREEAVTYRDLSDGL